jgi:uncharacterized protein
MHSVAIEWPETLDVNALLETGWRPDPFQEVVMKLNSRCNLACDYCYIYTMADQGWRHQPVRMSDTTIDEATARITEHAGYHKLCHLRVILHGGEPLLAGNASLERVIDGLHRRIPAGTSISISLQTNGVYLTEAKLELLDGLGIEIGVSLDGLQADHDRHRLRPDGGGSHAAVVAGLSRLMSERYRHLFRGILCTIDLCSDPIMTYNELERFEPPVIDFLLPHGNWTERPPGSSADFRKTPYADWLIKVFDHWYGRDVRMAGIRLFDEIMFQILGGYSRLDGFGLSSAQIIVIETDGSIQQSDFLKSAYPGAASTGLHVSRDSLDAALLLPPVAARQLGATALATTCRMCRIHRICGGGQYAHRYRAGYGFANPSVYCADLYRLIRHIRLRLAADLARVRESC